MISRAFKSISILFIANPENLEQYKSGKRWRGSHIHALILLISLDSLLLAIQITLKQGSYWFLLFAPLGYLLVLTYFHWCMYAPIYLHAPDTDLELWKQIRSAAYIQQLSILVLTKMAQALALSALQIHRIFSIAIIPIGILIFGYLLYKSASFYYLWYRVCYEFRKSRSIGYTLAGLLIYILTILLIVWLIKRI